MEALGLQLEGEEGYTLVGGIPVTLKVGYPTLDLGRVPHLISALVLMLQTLEGG